VKVPRKQLEMAVFISGGTTVLCCLVIIVCVLILSTKPIDPLPQPIDEALEDSEIQIVAEDKENVRVMFLKNPTTEDRMFILPDKNMDWRCLLLESFEQGYKQGREAGLKDCEKNKP